MPCGDLGTHLRRPAARTTRSSLFIRTSKPTTSVLHSSMQPGGLTSWSVAATRNRVSEYSLCGRPERRDLSAIAGAALLGRRRLHLAVEVHVRSLEPSSQAVIPRVAHAYDISVGVRLDLEVRVS